MMWELLEGGSMGASRGVERGGRRNEELGHFSVGRIWIREDPEVDAGESGGGGWEDP